MNAIQDHLMSMIRNLMPVTVKLFANITVLLVTSSLGTALNASMAQSQSTEIVDVPMAMLGSMIAHRRHRATLACLRTSVTILAVPASATAIPIPVPHVSVMQAFGSMIDQLIAIANLISTQAGQLQTASPTTTTPVASNVKPVK